MKRILRWLVTGHWSLITPVVLVRQPLLPDAELRGAFAVAEDNRLWRAVLQVIEEEEGAAVGAARQTIGTPPISGGFLGGSESLALLKSRLVGLRESATGERN